MHLRYMHHGAHTATKATTILNQYAVSSSTVSPFFEVAFIYFTRLSFQWEASCRLGILQGDTGLVLQWSVSEARQKHKNLS